jgi:nicotinate-nucleotide adenylyltransferase
MSARRIGILGGTFDPIHTGHIALAHAAERALDLACLFLVPSNVPPHRPQPATSSHHRFAMVSLAVMDRSGWQGSDVELQSPEPSYTSITLQRFRDLGYSAAELFFVIGADAFAEIATWRNYPDILDIAHFAVVSRPGFPVGDLGRRLAALGHRMAPATGSLLAPRIIAIDAPTPDVSSTDIRHRIGAGISIAGLVPPAVQHHIEQHRLYTSMTPGGCAADARMVPAARSREHGED